MRTVTFVGAVGLISIASLTVFNLAADRVSGLGRLRDYTVRRNG